MKHLDASLHVRGEAEYVDDAPPPKDLLHAAVYGSPLAHGKIKALHLKKAREIPGVVRILTAEDIPGENQIGPILHDEPLLADEEVHYQGQPLAVVIGKSPEIARKALLHIEVDMEELPVITDPREAFEKGHIMGNPRTFALGEVEEAFAECDIVVEGRCDIAGQEHLYLETQRCRAIPLEKGFLRLYSSTQSPYAVQKHMAQILGVPHHQVEVDVKRLGGGFGGKEDQATPWACMVGLAAWHLRKPVEIVLHRLEDMKMTGKRNPYSSDFKIGATREGKILAYKATHYQNAGASADLSPAVLERTLFHSTNSYFIPNVQVVGVSCRTNIPPNTAFRGFGGPQGMFVIESALAKLADTMGLPREELQERNLLSEGDMFPYGQLAQRALSKKTWQILVDNHYSTHKERVNKFNQENFGKKKGLAIMPVCFGISFTSTFMNQGSALVHVYTDGSVSVSTGGVEMGQGVNTKIAEIAARAFGISPDRIKIETTNTTRIANMSPSAASATTDLNGNATIIAVQQILERLKKLAAKEFKASDPENIEIRDEKIFYNGADMGWSWAELIEKAYLSRVGLSAHGFYATPKVQFDKVREKGRPFSYHVYGAALTEVTVDCLRGTYDLDSVKIVHDLGRTINPLVDRGQVEGGLAQGLGWMTLEELAYGEDGRLLSSALATYKAPDVYFMPDDLEITFIEEENLPGPYGSKAVGEPPLMYGIGVYFALREALKAFDPTGNFGYDAPMTPEKVLLQLHGHTLEEKKSEERSGSVSLSSEQQNLDPEGE